MHVRFVVIGVKSGNDPRGAHLLFVHVGWGDGLIIPEVLKGPEQVG